MRIAPGLMWPISTKKRVAIIAFSAILILCAAGVGVAAKILIDLPKLTSLEHYDPPQVTEVFAADGKKIGEYYRQKRKVVPYAQIPKQVVQAFISAEDATFFEHGGVNYLSIIRAAIANLRAGHTVQGGSTITQQVAKSFLLTPERTLTRKLKEFLLAQKIESNLSKEQILYLYLNQIYLGQGSYGVAAAAENYFRKDIASLTLAEAALLAGLPQAPSRYSPIHNSSRAKERQRYVLQRMAENHFISPDEAQKASQEPITVYLRENSYATAPFVLETIRQTLVDTLGEDSVLDGGLKVYSTIDLSKQNAAEESLRAGLRELDKRQGFRGPTQHLDQKNSIEEFLARSTQQLLDQYVPYRTILPDGKTSQDKTPTTSIKRDKRNVPDFLPIGAIVDGVVTEVENRLNLVFVRFAKAKGIIDLQGSWAMAGKKKASEVLNAGDVIRVKIESDKFNSTRLTAKSARVRMGADLEVELPSYVGLSLEQEPAVEGAVISFDIESGNLLAMAGGYDFEKKKFNHALQAYRQTGSAFKPIIYSAALDHGMTPATIVYDAPLVFGVDPRQNEELEDQPRTNRLWRPSNYEGRFTGDVIVRTALAHSMNVPTVRILDSVGVDFATTYARRLGIFSPLNPDLTMGLGSSSVSLFELTRTFETIAKLGRRPRTPFIQKVISNSGSELAAGITLETRYEDKMKPFNEAFELKRTAYLQASTSQPTPSPSPPMPAEGKEKKYQPNIYFPDPDQMISPQTAYLVTSLMKAVINEGTGARARSLGRPLAGKTGSTTDFHDSWFVGFSPQIITGVWAGYDEEKSLGHGETGANVALPIWMEYMARAHEGIAPTDFPVPPNIVFARIDLKTGKLVTSGTKNPIVEQAFLDGTEPSSKPENQIDEHDFLKEDMTE